METIPDDPVKHGRLSASRAAQFIACPASIPLSERIDFDLDQFDEADWREEGTRAHQVAAALLRGEEFTSRIGLDDLALEAVEVYVGHCRTLIGLPETLEWGIESDLACAANPDLSGHCDCWVLVGTTLIVVDYKHGEGVRVSALHNEQLLQYAFLVIDWLINETGARIERVLLQIVQPRYFGADEDSGYLQTWEVTPERVAQYKAEALLAAELVARADLKEITIGLGADDTKTGPHCRWCRARGICPGVYRQNVIALQGPTVPEISFAAPDELEPAHLEYVLKLEDEITAWLKAVRVFVKSEIQRGSTAYPSFKLVERLGNRRYNDENEALTVLGLAFGEPEVTETKLLSPAQIEKRFKKRAKDILEGLVHQPHNGYALCAIKNDKPAIEFTSAQDDFGAIES